MERPDFDVAAIVRPNILALKPYRCARDDYSAGILLDANENAYGPSLASPFNYGGTSYSDAHLERYPDPRQEQVKQLLCNLRRLPSIDHLFVGVGSDESLDLAIRIFCRPGKDKILITPPTYGMYSVCAQVNDVPVVKVPLLVEDGSFQLDMQKTLEKLRTDPDIKIVFLCSPGNPTGTTLKHSDIEQILLCKEYKGIVLVDEAYIDFDEPQSIVTWVTRFPNLVVTQTLSKAFGLAGARIGIAAGTPEVVRIFNNTKAPYNVSTPASLIARNALSDEGLRVMRGHVAAILENRAWLLREFERVPFFGRVLGSNQANFVLVQVIKSGKPDNQVAVAIYRQLAEHLGVVVRYRGMEHGCEGCLRITVGTEEENKQLIERLNSPEISRIVNEGMNE